MKKKRDFITTEEFDEKNEYFCKVNDYYYAHGQLQTDLGYDILLFNKDKFGKLPSFSGIYQMKHGRKNCTLFAWVANSPCKGSRKGLLVYDSDKKAYADAKAKYEQKKAII